MNGGIARIIEQIKQEILIEKSWYWNSRPVALTEVEASEQMLGFELPELLRKLYTEVANGGFGPYGHLIGLKGGWFTTHGEAMTLVELYKDCQIGLPFFSLWRWPEKLLPICEDGRELICLDCSKLDTPVIRFGYKIPNMQGAGWNIKVSYEATSFQEWLESWIIEKVHKT